MVSEKLEFVRRRIRETCSRCGRAAEDVLLVGVTKKFGTDTIREAIAAGLLDIGENYAQELLEKRALLDNAPIRWHFIGHLQSNKVRYLIDNVFLIHSVDNLGVAEEIQKRAVGAGKRVDVLVEVHTTDEATKHGVAPGRTIELLKQISRLDGVRVQGLMTMGPFSDDPDDSRPSFKCLADLRDQVCREGIENISMRQLSMGMSHDFEVAIEEGATILRIGTAIFGMRPKAV